MQNIDDQMNGALCGDHKELSYYLEWQWPEEIEKVLHRMLWISLVEAAEPKAGEIPHTNLLRRLIAAYHEAPQEVLDYLAGVADAEVLWRIAENPQSKPETLDKLSRRMEEKVQAAVAENPLTPPEALLWLSKNACPDVRHAMAENSALPLRVLQELCTDENVYVGERAKKTLARRSKGTVRRLDTCQKPAAVRKAM